MTQFNPPTPPPVALSRSVGSDSVVNADIDEHQLLAEDILLLSSDGLHGSATAEEIAAVISRFPDLREAARALVSLACDKAKDHGHPHELWTTRLLARHAREHGPAAGHACLAKLVQGTVCKILGKEEIKPHKVRYYLENRDAEFEQKMAEVLCVYREVAVLKKASKSKTRRKPVAETATAAASSSSCSDFLMPLIRRARRSS